MVGKFNVDRYRQTLRLDVGIAVHGSVRFGERAALQPFRVRGRILLAAPTGAHSTERG